MQDMQSGKRKRMTLHEAVAVLTSHAFHRASTWFVAGRWRRLGGTLLSLAATLACPESDAIKVGLCRAPVAGEDLDAWSARVAEYAGLDVGRVRALAERIAVR